jgi:hypothetical protein
MKKGEENQRTGRERREGAEREGGVGKGSEQAPSNKKPHGAARPDGPAALPRAAGRCSPS